MQLTGNLAPPSNSYRLRTKLAMVQRSENGGKKDAFASRRSERSTSYFADSPSIKERSSEPGTPRLETPRGNGRGRGPGKIGWGLIAYITILMGLSVTFYHKCCIEPSKEFFIFQYRNHLRSIDPALDAHYITSLSDKNGVSTELILELIEFPKIPSKDDGVNGVEKSNISASPSVEENIFFRGPIIASALMNMSMGQEPTASLPSGLQVRWRAEGGGGGGGSGGGGGGGFSGPVDFCVCLGGCSARVVRDCRRRGGVAAVWDTAGCGRRGGPGGGHWAAACGGLLAEGAAFRDAGRRFGVDGYLVPNAWQLGRLAAADPARPAAVVPAAGWPPPLPPPHSPGLTVGVGAAGGGGGGGGVGGEEGSALHRPSPLEAAQSAAAALAARPVGALGFLKLGPRWGAAAGAAVKAPASAAQAHMRALAARLGLEYRPVVLGEGADAGLAPGRWGEGLFRGSAALRAVGAAFIWPNEPGNFREVATESAAALLYWWARGVPALVYPYPAAEDLAEPQEEMDESDRQIFGNKGYPGIISTLDEAEYFLTRIVEDYKFRSKVIQDGLLRAHKFSFFNMVKLYPVVLCKMFKKKQLRPQLSRFCIELESSLEQKEENFDVDHEKLSNSSTSSAKVLHYTKRNAQQPASVFSSSKRSSSWGVHLQSFYKMNGKTRYIYPSV